MSSVTVLPKGKSSVTVLPKDSHINIVIGRCFLSLRLIRTIRRSLTLDSARTLVSSLVMSRIDYCNCLLAGLPAHSIARLQFVLNAGARVIHQRRKFDHITDVLRNDLYWLPVAQRIQFKLCVTVFKALHNLAPTYISNMCVAPILVRSSRRLRSADDAKLDVPRTKTEFGKRAFAVSGPSM